MKPRRSVCPVACTLDILGDKWTLLVVRDMLLGRSLFKEFMASPEGIATNILSDRLQRLVECGIAERFTPDDARGKDAYRLTPKGKELRPVIRAMLKWGEKHVEGSEARLKP